MRNWFEWNVNTLYTRIRFVTTKKGLKMTDPKDKEEECDEESHSDYKCGWFGIKPKFLQVFRTPKWALFFLCLGTIVEGLVVNGLMNVVLSTLERRFNLSSKESGMIRATNSISQMIATFPISYFGGKGCKPKYLGLGIISLGIGALIFTLPHFLSDVYHPSVTSTDDSIYLCTEKNFTNPLDSSSRSSYKNFQNLKNLFFLGQIFHGIGSAPLWTIGVTYLDENLPTKTSAMYVGIFYAFAVIGPAIGFLGGGQFLKVHTDFSSIQQFNSTTIDESHPNWVGLWWIGFIFAGVLSLLIGALLVSFPSKLPGWSNIQRKKLNEAVLQEEKVAFIETKNESDQNFVTRVLKPIWTDVKTLSSNRPFACICLNQTTEGLLFAVFSAFMPKFLESQFQLSASDAAFYVGIIIVFLGSFGMIFGGWLVKRFNLSCKAILLLIFFATLSQVPQLLAFLFLSCDSGTFAGVNFPLQYKKSDIPVLEQACNAGCVCGGKFDPVCGSNDVMFFNSCYAGCTEHFNSSDWTYANCQCALTTTNRLSNSTIPFELRGMAKVGICPQAPNCKPWKLYPFLFLFALLVFPMLSVTAPAMQATLRCVPSHLKSVALGIQLVMSRSLGAVPGPPIFGSIIDSVCLVSLTQTAKEGKACALYDKNNLSVIMFLIAGTWKLFSLLFIFAAWFFYRSYLKRNRTGENENDPKIQKTLEKPSTEDRNGNEFGIELTT